MNYNKDILRFKDILTNMLITYNNLAKDECINKRNENNIEQIKADRMPLINMRNCALSIFDKCNEIIANTTI